MANALQKVIEFAKDKPIDGVLTWSDRDVELVSLIAEKLDIPAPNIDRKCVAGRSRTKSS